MSNIHKGNLLKVLQDRFGRLRKLGGSESLFTVGKDVAHIYIRYSKVHKRGRTFFGLREIDLRQLEGHNAYLCFLLDDDSPPVFIPFADFEEIFRGAQVASDGQYKVQLVSQHGTRELYVARHGRFNVEGYVGFKHLEDSIDATRSSGIRDLSHSQVQTLLAGIGHMKGYDICVPGQDVGALDWSLTEKFALRKDVPNGFEDVADVLSEIDVIWIAGGRNSVEALFEVEHSTPVYSGLLRFNDVLLTHSEVSRFSIVSNDSRRSLFARQVFRPTFRKSGLAECVSFLEYCNALDWHRRLVEGQNHGQNEN